jgi:hypothetical protein
MHRPHTRLRSQSLAPSNDPQKKPNDLPVFTLRNKLMSIGNRKVGNVDLGEGVRAFYDDLST